MEYMKTSEKNINFFKSEANLKNNKTYLILSDSIFNLIVYYNELFDETIINYKKIIYKNIEGEYEAISINQIKDVNEENNISNNYYKKFVEYLEILETRLKEKYKKKQGLEIFLKFKMQNNIINSSNNYNVNCYFKVNKYKNQGEEFYDENILNKNNMLSLCSIINKII